PRGPARPWRSKSAATASPRRSSSSRSTGARNAAGRIPPETDGPRTDKPQDSRPMDPKTLRFSPTHEWVSLDGDVATVGISKFAVDQLTDLIMIDLPSVGTRLTAGKTFGEVESVKAVSDLYAPVS